MRVSVIEDDLSIAHSLDEGLTRHGFTVDRTTSGRDGVRRAPSFDLVLLDLWSPISTARTCAGPSVRLRRCRSSC